MDGLLQAIQLRGNWGWRRSCGCRRPWWHGNALAGGIGTAGAGRVCSGGVGGRWWAWKRVQRRRFIACRGRVRGAVQRRARLLAGAAVGVGRARVRGADGEFGVGLRCGAVESLSSGWRWWWGFSDHLVPVSCHRPLLWGRRTKGAACDGGPMLCEDHIRVTLLADGLAAGRQAIGGRGARRRMRERQGLKGQAVGAQTMTYRVRPAATQPTATQSRTRAKTKGLEGAIRRAARQERGQAALAL